MARLASTPPLRPSPVFSPTSAGGSLNPQPVLKGHQWVSLRCKPGSATLTEAEVDAGITRRSREMCHTNHTVLSSFKAKASSTIPSFAYELLCHLHDPEQGVKVYLERGKWAKFVYAPPPKCKQKQKPWLDMILARMFQSAAYAEEMRASFTPLFAGGPFALGGPAQRQDGRGLAVGFTRPVGPLDNGEILQLPGWTHGRGYPSLLLVLLALAFQKVTRMREQGDGGGLHSVKATDPEYVLDGWTEPSAEGLGDGGAPATDQPGPSRDEETPQDFARPNPPAA